MNKRELMERLSVLIEGAMDELATVDIAQKGSANVFAINMAKSNLSDALSLLCD